MEFKIGDIFRFPAPYGHRDRMVIGIDVELGQVSALHFVDMNLGPGPGGRDLPAGAMLILDGGAKVLTFPIELMDTEV